MRNNKEQDRQEQSRKNTHRQSRLKKDTYSTRVQAKHFFQKNKAFKPENPISPYTICRRNP